MVNLVQLELAAQRPEGEIEWPVYLSLRHRFAVPPPSSEGGVETAAPQPLTPIQKKQRLPGAWLPL